MNHKISNVCNDFNCKKCSKQQCGTIPTFIHTGIRNVSHSSCLNDVSDDKLLDSFVLGDTAGTVGAAHILGVATALLGASVVSSFLSLN